MNREHLGGGGSGEYPGAVEGGKRGCDLAAFGATISVNLDRTLSQTGGTKRGFLMIDDACLVLLGGHMVSALGMYHGYKISRGILPT